MKNPWHILCGLALLCLAACSPIFRDSQDTPPLSLTLELSQRDVVSFDDLQCRIVLTNQGNSSLLVNKRLHSETYPAPASLSEVAIWITDSSGNPVYGNTFPNYELPKEDMLKVLLPGEQATRRIRLTHIFTPNLFKKGEAYTIVAIYQNELDITQTIGGVEVPSWVGSVRSNEEMFFIKP